MKNSPPDHPLDYQFGEFTLDVARGCVWKAGEEIKLRPKVYETLKYFIENSGRLIGKQELMQAVWPDAFVTDDSLVQCTLELRRALDDRDQKILKTVPRRGYLFTASVTRIPLAPASPRVADPPAESLSGLRDRDDGLGPLPAKVPRRRRDLPVPRTSLIGREQQVAEASELLLRPNVRVLTLTGPGGAGKTRLSLAVAAAIAGHFPAGVQFVNLASITDPGLVAAALAEAMEIQQLAHRSIPELIGDKLRSSGPFLLLLDNFEQILPAATVVAETLDACPALKVLITSRSCLRIYGEQEFPLAPLAPGSAVELFAQRAAAVWPDFVITLENSGAVQEICARLDGLPLAIELAAARTKVLPPTAILDRLQSRLLLLTGGALDLPERHQTLRKTIDWSHDLLNEAERTLFRRLSVFAGGCTLEAAEAVCNTGLDLGVDLMEGLSALMDQNLVQRLDRAEAEPRFSMLETIREYALERLADNAEMLTVRRAHAAYCLVLAEEGNPDLDPPARAVWLAQCDAEIDNLRAALDWLFQSDEIDWSLRLCVALFRFWDMREHMTEGRSRLEAVLLLAGPQHLKERARVSHFLGALTTTQGDFTSAHHFLEQALSLYEDLGDDPGIAASLNALAITARDRGDYISAQSYFERSLACWRLLPNRIAVARCLHNLANVVKVRGDYARARWALHEAAEIFEEQGDRSGAAWSLNQQGDIERDQYNVCAARALYERALASFREVKDPWGSARCLTDLAYIDCEQGNHEAAHAAYREALAIFADLGHRRGIARVLEGSACLAWAEGHAARALILVAAAASLRQIIGAPLPQAEQTKLDTVLHPVWIALGEPDGAVAWAEGSNLSLEQSIEFSLDVLSGRTQSR